MGERRAAGQLEADIQAVLWSAERPLTASEVLDRLGGGLAYTTVMTILTRLHEKKAVTRARAGRAFAYSPAPQAADTAAARMLALLNGGVDRMSVLARFVDTLSHEDERMLRRLLNEPQTTGE